MELRFSHWGSSGGYFKGVEHFSEGDKDFWRDGEIFKFRGLRLFHDG